MFLLPLSRFKTWFSPFDKFLSLWGVIALVVISTSYQCVLAVQHKPLGYGSPTVKTPDSAQFLEESRGKLMYCAAISLLVFTLIWNIFLSGFVIWRQRSCGVKLKAEYRTYFLLLIFTILWSVLIAGTPFNLGGWYEDQLLDRVWGVESIWMDGVVFIADLITAVAILLILGMLGYLVADRSPDDMANLASRINTYKISIYSAGLSLGAGVFEIYALYSWSAMYAGDGEISSALVFSSTMTVATGLLFTTLMIVMYLPVAFTLNRQLWTYYRSKGGTQKGKTKAMQEWAATYGVSTTPLSVFGSYVAILVPFATGILARILQIQS